MKHLEVRRYEFTHTGALAAGVAWLPSPVDLQSDEVGEIIGAEVYPPLSGLGADELIQNWYPVVDGRTLDNYLNLNGTRSPNMTPPETNTKGNIINFGVPVVKAAGKKDALLLARCPKFTDSVGVKVFAGTGGITGDFTIALKVMVYEDSDLTRIPAFPALVSIDDPARNRTIPIGKPAWIPNSSNWLNGPGGYLQTNPKINPYMAWTTNKNATTPNTPYDFRLEGSNIDPAYPWQEFYFDYGKGRKAMIILGLGTRADTNQLQTAIKINGDVHPYNWISTLVNRNPIPFGLRYPFTAAKEDYYPIPRLKFGVIPAEQAVIFQEIGTVEVQDNGVAIAAGNAMLALNAIQVEYS